MVIDVSTGAGAVDRTDGVGVSLIMGSVSMYRYCKRKKRGIHTFQIIRERPAACLFSKAIKNRQVGSND